MQNFVCLLVEKMMLNTTHHNISLMQNHTRRILNTHTVENININSIKDVNDSMSIYYTSVINATTSLPKVIRQDNEMGVFECLANFIRAFFFLLIILGIMIFFGILTGGQGCDS